MHNTIILKKGTDFLNKKEYEKFQKGDSIFGENSDPEEIKRWNIEEKAQAIKELEKYRCSYEKRVDTYDITEYALEYCECDDDGEFVQGHDYDLAAE